jgi:hypothetical protein
MKLKFVRHNDVVRCCSHALRHYHDENGKEALDRHVSDVISARFLETPNFAKFPCEGLPHYIFHKLQLSRQKSSGNPLRDRCYHLQAEPSIYLCSLLINVFHELNLSTFNPPHEDIQGPARVTISSAKPSKRTPGDFGPGSCRWGYDG